MKKLGIILLCILLLLGVCACGETTPEEGTISPTTTQTVGQTTVGGTAATVKTTQKTTAPTLKTTAVPKTTVKATTATTKAAPAWKGFYLAVLAVEKKNYDKFSLVHIDGDNIPELYMSGSNGDTLYAFRNNTLISRKLNKNNTAYYIPKSGRFANVFTDGDHLALEVYELNSAYIGDLLHAEEYFLSSEESVIYLNGAKEPLSEEDGMAAVTAKFDINNATKLKANAVSVDEIKTQINNW